MKRVVLFLASILIFSCAGFSKEIDFRIAGLLTPEEQNVHITADWDDSFFFDSAFNYNHKLARIAGILSEISYADISGNQSENILIETYRKLGVKDSYMELHYDVDYSLPVYGPHQAAFSFAAKEIFGPQGKQSLIFIIIRGTPYVASEWISNFDIMEDKYAQSGIHEGFSKCLEQIHNALLFFMLKHGISPEEACFFISGHSRGAAVSNLMGARLCDEGIFRAEKIFVYTFACPNIIQRKENLDEKKYGFIWNIINAEDAVPALPPCRGNWLFQKYGHTLTMVNRWNVDAKSYDEKFYPKMNSIYRSFIGRDYHPFKNGPFVQSQFVRIVTDNFNKIEDYYGNIFNFPNIAKEFVKNYFTENGNTQPGQYTKGQNWFLDFLNGITDNGIENISLMLTDMHSSEQYLAWVLALDEKELYSELGNFQIVLDGFYECAIFDEDQNLVAQILDGAVQYEKINLPLAATPLMGKNTAIGFPATENFTVVIHKESLAPTVISARLEYYDASGKLVSAENKKYLYPHIGMGLKFTAGKIFVEDRKISAEKIHGQELKDYIDLGDLEQQEKFFIYPELSIDVDGQLGAGVHIGKPNIYGSLLTFQPLSEFGSVLELSPGIGHQNAIFANLMLDAEFYTRFIYVFRDVEGSGWNFVPSLRLMLSFKPRNYLQIFVAGSFDLNIKNFNDAPFNPLVHNRCMGPINLGDYVKIIPTVSFGIKI